MILVDLVPTKELNLWTIVITDRGLEELQKSEEWFL